MDWSWLRGAKTICFPASSVGTIIMPLFLKKSMFYSSASLTVILRLSYPLMLWKSNGGILLIICRIEQRFSSAASAAGYLPVSIFNPNCLTSPSIADGSAADNMHCTPFIFICSGMMSAWAARTFSWFIF